MTNIALNTLTYECERLPFSSVHSGGVIVNKFYGVIFACIEEKKKKASIDKLKQTRKGEGERWVFIGIYIKVKD